MQGSARKDVVFGATRVDTVTVPGPKWKSWLNAFMYEPILDMSDDSLKALYSEVRNLQ